MLINGCSERTWKGELQLEVQGGGLEGYCQCGTMNVRKMAAYQCKPEKMS